MPNKEGRWVTIHGRAVFIAEGQSLEEALNSKGQVKKAAGGSSGYDRAESSSEQSASDIQDMFDGEFWTRREELEEALEDRGLEVTDANDEYISVASEDDNEYILYLGRANGTTWIKRVEEA